MAFKVSFSELFEGVAVLATGLPGGALFVGDPVGRSGQLASASELGLEVNDALVAREERADIERGAGKCLDRRLSRVTGLDGGLERGHVGVGLIGGALGDREVGAGLLFENLAGAGDARKAKLKGALHE